VGGLVKTKDTRDRRAAVAIRVMGAQSFSREEVALLDALFGKLRAGESGFDVLVRSDAFANVVRKVDVMKRQVRERKARRRAKG